MENRALAKSRPIETIAEHTALVRDNLDLLRRLYPQISVDWEILEMAVLFHDLGKINSKFQNKLYRQLKIPPLPDLFPQAEEIPHGNISVVFLDRKKLVEKFDPDTLRILYQSIYHHHPRYLPRDKIAYLKEFIDRDLPQYMAAIPIPGNYFNPAPKIDFHRYTDQRIDCPNEGDKTLFYRYVLVKGLLNRLDYAASAHIEVEIPNHELEQKTLAFLQTLGGLRDIQSHLLQKQEENHVIVASTGIGKTEAGLLWIGNNKGFFTLPLRVSINAIYERIKLEKIGFPGTALLHSDALAFLVKRDESIDYLAEYTKARQLSMPLTITTIDQLFKFVFKEEGFESILATLSFSKIIIDEIQMYSPQLVACILMGLKYIHEIGGKFTILTATFPEVLAHFMQGLGITYDYREFILEQKRHRMALQPGDIVQAVPDIIEKAGKSKVLVIVNTVGKAQQLFQALGNIRYKHLLHSRFIKSDRRELEKEIIEFSRGTGTGVWVATQVVEASLDLDFDYLYTELSTIDGLFQRMGRCYRKRELAPQETEANVNVYIDNPSGIGKIIDREIFDLSRQALKPYNGRVISETKKLALVKDIYSLEKIKVTQYYKTIKKHLDLLENIPAYEFDRKEVDEKFRNIKSYTVIPIAIYDREKDTIREKIEDIQLLGFSPTEKIRHLQKIEEIMDITVDVPAYLGTFIVDRIALDKKNTVRIIDLEYDSRLGLIPRRTDFNFI